MRDETCSVVRIGIECNDCNRDKMIRLVIDKMRRERSVSEVVWIV